MIAFQLSLLLQHLQPQTYPLRLGCYPAIVFCTSLATDHLPQSGWPVICCPLGVLSTATSSSSDWHCTEPLIFIPSRFVALKITVADFQAGSHEARILKILANDSIDNIEGSQHILSLLDNFQIQGPNGTHEVFVTEVVASLSDLKCYPVYSKVRRYQI